MNRRKPILTYVIFTLMGIGIFIQILNGSQAILTAVIVFGAVFLLYRYPPAKWKRAWKPASKRRAKPARKRAMRKFRVVDGKKRSDKNRPPYH